MIGARSWRDGSPIRRERSAATKPTNDCCAWDTPEPIAPPAVRWLKSNLNGDWVIHACTDPGSPNLAYGCSTTSPMARSSRGARSSFWWRGWRGVDTGSWFRCGIGVRPASSRDWTGSSASWAAHRPTCSPTTKRPSPPDTSPGSRSATARPSHSGGTTASRC